MKKLTSLILIGFVAVNFTFAQDADSKSEKKNENTEVFKLSIDEAVDYALAHSRTLKSNDIDLEIKARASKYSWNVFLPTLQASGTLKRANEISPSYAAAGLTDFPDEESRWDTIGAVSASWNFTPAYVAQIKIAKAQYEAGKVSWEQSQRETITNIKMTSPARMSLSINPVSGKKAIRRQPFEIHQPARANDAINISAELI